MHPIRNGATLLVLGVLLVALVPADAGAQSLPRDIHDLDNGCSAIVTPLGQICPDLPFTRLRDCAPTDSDPTGWRDAWKADLERSLYELLTFQDITLVDEATDDLGFVCIDH